MFLTTAYKGHYIQYSRPDRCNVETIEAQLMFADGGFKLVRCKTPESAKRQISLFIKKQTTGKAS